MKYCRKIAWH